MDTEFKFDPRVVELMASRVCHDLVSPVGAISNGVELINDMGQDALQDALGLIGDSAGQASVRLKCFRLSYGAAGTDRNIGFAEVQDAFGGWVKGSHVTVDFEQGLGLKFSMPPRGFMKVLLNLMMFAEECSRGVATMAVTAMEGNAGVNIRLTGARVAPRDGAADALKGVTAIDDLDARTVHAYLTGAFAKSFGLTVDLAVQEGQIDFMLKI